MITRITETITASPDKVWEIFAHDFDDAYKWMSIYHSHHEDIGEWFPGAKTNGRICDLDSAPKGKKAVEQFTAYDEDGKSCTIKVEFENMPLLFPIRYNEASVKMTEDPNNKDQTRIEWTVNSHLKTPAYLLYPIIKSGFGGAVGGILKELKYYAENDAPHPRVMKATKKANE